MSRRRVRSKPAKARRPADPLSGLFGELAERTHADHPPGPSGHATPLVRVAERVERLAYTRSQAAAALGLSPATFTRRVLPLIETIEMPWGTQLVPADELERVASEGRRPAGPRPKPRPVGRRPALPEDVAARIAGEHAAGKSLGQIARGLNADGVPTAHGGRRWWPSTIRVVLSRVTTRNGFGNEAI